MNRARRKLAVTVAALTLTIRLLAGCTTPLPPGCDIIRLHGGDPGWFYQEANHSWHAPLPEGGSATVGYGIDGVYFPNGRTVWNQEICIYWSAR